MVTRFLNYLSHLLKRILSFLLRRTALLPEERAELASKANLYVIGGRLLSDPNDPYAVAGAFARQALKDDGVAQPSQLSDARLLALRDIMTACLGEDGDFAAMLRKAPAQKKPMLKKVRATTAPGRAVIQDPARQASERSAEAVIARHGLKPVAPVRMPDQSASSAKHGAIATQGSGRLH